MEAAGRRSVAVLQSPQEFLALEEVLAADHRCVDLTVVACQLRQPAAQEGARRVCGEKRRAVSKLRCSRGRRGGATHLTAGAGLSCAGEAAPGPAPSSPTLHHPAIPGEKGRQRSEQTQFAFIGTERGKLHSEMRNVGGRANRGQVVLTNETGWGKAATSCSFLLRWLLRRDSILGESCLPGGRALERET